MPELTNQYKIFIEKNLSKNLLRYAVMGVSIWSIIRVSILNEYSKSQIDYKIINFSTPLNRWRKYPKDITIFIKFIFGLIKHRSASVVFHVNSFSISNINFNNQIFTSKNLQSIYCIESKKNKCIVLINNLNKWAVHQPINGCIVTSSLLTSVITLLLKFLRINFVDKISGEFSEKIRIDKKIISRKILDAMAGVITWYFYYKILGVKKIYFESPHNSLEPQVIAAKILGVYTVEIFHGVVTKYEPSYYQRHLDFNGLINSTCNEYLSPNTQQNKFIRYSNPHYDKLLNIKFIPNLSFSRGEIYSAKKFIRKCTKKTFLVVTSITDNDVKEVITFLKKNKKYLRGEYDNLILRIHPEDSKSRWMPLLRKNRSIKLSKSDLKTNIMRSTEILTSSKTVALQLSSNGLNCIELGLEKKCLRY